MRLAVDIGGTFTDGVLIEDGTDRTWAHKVLTTPADPSEGFIDVVDVLLRAAGCRPTNLVSVTHATTITTNTLLQRRGAKTALLTTAGFEDILEIGRQIRHALYDLQTNKPVPLVPRAWCHPIGERLDHAGRVLVPLDEGTVVAAVDRIAADGVESIAICFLHAYVNDVHEQRAAAIVRERLPGVRVSVSSEIAPQIKEYWRASTTVVNAYVAPVMDRYLSVIEAKLRGRGIRAPLHVMGSSGALMTAATARARPVDLVESGPAAGVSAAVRVADALGVRDAISFDMGGTTAKVGLILDGEARTLSEFEVGAAQGSGTAVAIASGYPILGSIVDLVEVGAGGGSIAWIDSGGLPRVGPHSAGADPGPASYGRGGTDPTVTDANAVLGRIVPERFAEGVVELDVEAAVRAFEPLAGALGIDVDEAAAGVIRVAESVMAEAIRLVSVERGHDPRDFTLIAFGGAGPLHANRLAAELGIPTTVIPPNPSVLSALGMLLSDFRHEHRRTRILPLAPESEAAIGEILERLEADARESLRTDRIVRRDRRLRRRLEARYVGQSWTLTIDLRARLPAAIVREVRRSFDERHRLAYGYALEAEPIEIVSFTVVGVGVNRSRALRVAEAEATPGAALAKGARSRLRRRRRAALEVGRPVAGPIVIDEPGSTTVVERGYSVTRDAAGMLLVSRVVRP
jgi:N-methylhydantoinase A